MNDTIYVVGSQRIDGPPSIVTSFIAKYAAADGKEAWRRSFQITEDYHWESGYDITVDQKGNIYAVGTYEVDPNNTGKATSFALYLAKFEPEKGDLLWMETKGGGVDDLRYEPGDVKVDGNGDVIVIGHSYIDAQTDDSDIFVWKLSGRDQ